MFVEVYLSSQTNSDSTILNLHYVSPSFEEEEEEQEWELNTSPVQEIFGLKMNSYVWGMMNKWFVNLPVVLF